MDASRTSPTDAQLREHGAAVMRAFEAWLAEGEQLHPRFADSLRLSRAHAERFRTEFYEEDPDA